jgi:serine/threonine protein kinase
LLEGELGAKGIYLTDFGLVRGVDSAESGLTRTGQVIANLDYAAPEQIKSGWIDARIDVYSLGCVLFSMCSGVRPSKAPPPRRCGRSSTNRFLRFPAMTMALARLSLERQPKARRPKENSPLPLLTAGQEADR